MTPAVQRVDRQVLQDKALTALSNENRPFLRWAGSKRRLLVNIVAVLPDSFSRYYEPFLGAGSLFFLLQPDKALLSDINADLVSTWRAVRDMPDLVHTRAHAQPLSEVDYYTVRSRTGATDAERAGDFIYLNRGAFNGLYRVNRQGKFNVPWGSPRSLNVIDKDVLTSASDLLRSGKKQLETIDFAQSIGRARAGDLIYLDPPYVTTHNNNGFIDYNERLFSWKDQVRLALSAERAVDRGATVIVSNALHKDVIALYKGFEVHEISRQSSIAGDPAKRGKTSEALLVGRPNG